MRRALLVLVLAQIASGCLSGVWRREMRLTPVSADAVAGLVAEHSTLEQCLAALGAPLYVWEYQGDGLALAYGFYRNKGFGVTVSVPVQDQSASFDYEDDRAHLRGYVLLFDEHWTLTEVRSGELRDLERLRNRARPAAPDEG